MIIKIKTFSGENLYIPEENYLDEVMYSDFEERGFARVDQASRNAEIAEQAAKLNLTPEEFRAQRRSIQQNFNVFNWEESKAALQESGLSKDAAHDYLHERSKNNQFHYLNAGKRKYKGWPEIRNRYIRDLSYEKRKGLKDPISNMLNTLELQSKASDLRNTRELEKAAAEAVAKSPKGSRLKTGAKRVVNFLKRRARR